MRHPMVPALLVLLALIGYALFGAVAVGASSAPEAVGPSSAPVAVGPSSAPVAVNANSAHAATTDQFTENGSVSGTVTDEDGRPVADAYVLIEPSPAEHLREATDGDRNVAEYLLRMGMTDLEDVKSVRTDDDGHYRFDVPSGTYELVAVTEDRAVSRLHEVSADGDSTVDPTVDPDRVLRIEGEQVTVVPGNETSVTLRLENTDDDTVRSLVVGYGELPSGWAVESVATDGREDPAERQVTWDTIGPGETASVRLTLSILEDAEPGHHTVGVSADAETHFVEQTIGIRVRVEPPGWTPTATHTSVPGGDDIAGSDGEYTEGDNRSTDTPSETPTTAPGLGVGATGLALAALVVGLVRRTRRR